MASGDRAHGRRPARFLGALRLPQRRGPVQRGTLWVLSCTLARARLPEVMRTRSEAGRLVVGVEQRATVDREAAATDAGREPAAQRLERLDPAIEVSAPAA